MYGSILKISAIIFCVFVVSCTTNIDDLSINQEQNIDYIAISDQIKNEINEFSDLLKMDTEGRITDIIKNINENIEIKGKVINPKTEKYLNEHISVKTHFSKNDLSDSFSENQKTFLISFYNDLANPDRSLNEIILHYNSLLISSDLSKNEKGQILVQLTIAESTLKVIDQLLMNFEFSDPNDGNACDAYQNCINENLGRNVSQGMVWGAVTGGIAGAAGGTVVLPGIGTTTGAVGGTVFGAAQGATVGALGGAVWTSLNCTRTLSQDCLKKLFA